MGETKNLRFKAKRGGGLAIVAEPDGTGKRTKFQETDAETNCQETVSEQETAELRRLEVVREDSSSVARIVLGTKRVPSVLDMLVACGKGGGGSESVDKKADDHNEQAHTKVPGLLETLAGAGLQANPRGGWTTAEPHKCAEAQPSSTESAASAK